jgi:tRNA-splicing ligase RtcB (3'-phosphate/5'-hydroxy nucleic acid ligase)
VKIAYETPYRIRIQREGKMRVPGIVYASKALLPDPRADKSLEQVVNVAHLPGIVGASYAMPDMHWGYGFPIGGVAATDVAAGGVVSPGGVGFDISCGVRLYAADVLRGELTGRQLEGLLDQLDKAIPRGVGKGAVWKLAPERLPDVLAGGSRYAVEQGHGVPRDLDRCEDGGAVGGADTAGVSERALERGLAQIGSLGSGNHFLEVQAVADVYDRAAASAFGLRKGQICVMIHCGSRGLGHQICTDHVRTMEKAMAAYGVEVPDRQLAAVPVDSPEGRAYLAGMAAAANYARANRQLLGEQARRIFGRVGGWELDLVYDVSHNLAKIEEHEVDGERRTLCVHRKGATLALPPDHPDLPDDLRPVGQPVLIPGSMGTGSYVLTGVRGGGAFHSTCHGAGRVMSRHQAEKSIRIDALRRQMADAGVLMRGASNRGLLEEAPAAYKDVDEVVRTAEEAGLCAAVARLIPLGVVNG